VTVKLQHLGECGWFWIWSLVGACAALGFVSLGFLLLVPVLLVAIAIQRFAHPPGRAALGLISGVGLLFLLVAYLNRHGPFDAHTWGTVGVLLLTAGVLAFALRRRSARAAS
jgi:MprA protease rhombosortase-interaction domain-containing protein